MATKTSTIKVNITGDARDALRAINETTGQMMTMQQKTSTALSGMAGAIASAGIVSKMGEIAKACTDAASELQQSQGAVDAVFGDTAGQILDFSKHSAESTGLATSDFQQMASVIGSQLKNMGMPLDQVAGKTTDLISLGSDLSAMYGGTAKDAVDALSAALRGEMDPLEQYGVSLNDAKLQSYAAANGMLDLYKAGDTNAKMMAILSGITDQTKDSLGTFARESDTAAGSSQIMQARFKDAQAALGEALLPALTTAADKLAEFAEWVQQNTSWLTPLAVVIGVVAAAIIGINAAMAAYAAVTAVAAVAQGALNIALLPVIAIIAAIIAIIILCVQNWETIKAVASAAASAIQGAWQTFWGWLSGVFGAIGSWFGEKWEQVKAAGTNAVNSIKAAWNGITAFFSGIGDGIRNAFAAPIDWVVSRFEWLRDKISGIIDGIKGVANSVGDFVGGIVGKAAQAPQAAQTMAMQPVAMRAYRPSTIIDGEYSARPSGMAAPRLPAGDMRTLSAAARGGVTVNQSRTYQVTITGEVIDRQGTAKAIRKLLSDYEAVRR